VHLLKEVEKRLGKYIEKISFEGPNLVIYTRNKSFFLASKAFVIPVVNRIKRRIEVRMLPETLVEEEKTKKIIEDLLPRNLALGDICFDKQRSCVYIEVDRPALVDESVIYQIKEKTNWTPKVRRTPLEKSPIIETIRYIIRQSSGYRQKLMESVGKRIFSVRFKRDKSYFARISFLGGTREVGRSCYLIQTKNSNILLDCGISLSNIPYPYPRFDILKIDPEEIDAVIISHAHADHFAFLPWLFKIGYKGPVYMTEPTREIGTLICSDYIEIQRMENKEPIYSEKELRQMLKHIIPLPYDYVVNITDDVKICLSNAGHILGSAIIHLNIGEGFLNLVYTGDFKKEGTFLLEKPSISPPRIEVMLIESTYGGSEDITPTRFEAKEELIQIINEAIERRSKVLIPVLGVGRAQEIIYALVDAFENKKIKEEIPLYLDGMVWDITAIYVCYPEFLKKEIADRILNGENPFKYENIIRVNKDKSREEIIQEKGPAIILSTSGMLTGGPSVSYLEEFCEEEDNFLVFVSYQAENTLGRQILDGMRTLVRIKNNKTIAKEIKMNVRKITGFSGHSNRKEIEEFIENLRAKPRRYIIVHGEKEKSVDLAKYLNKKYRVETNVPRVGDSLRLR